ncbi:MAG: DUF1549 domain-containing protein, partial [Planctomycetaceae bacterium]|nr:DUF1549 domain-containing protein [Planctomycetaceae bacterium]
KPETIRGWIDGRSTNGKWDMGGPTSDAPVVDNDDVWIGASMAGSANSSLNGLLDEIVLHRAVLTDAAMTAKFRRVGGPRVIGPLPEEMPVVENVPAGSVVVQLSEQLPTHERWLNEGETWPEGTLRWSTNQFLLSRIPQRFDDWGIRTAWKAPVLLRMVGDVDLPVGEQTFLLRARALGRLWIDGQLIARTEALTRQPPNGEEPMTPVNEAPLPGLRPAGYHQQEVVAPAPIVARNEGDTVRRCRIVLELVVGGKNLRTETGEVCVALRSEAGDSYQLLMPKGVSGESRPIPLTDTAIEPCLKDAESAMAEMEDRLRRSAATSQHEFWTNRHQVAKDYLQSLPANVVPQTSRESDHPVDRFLTARVQQLREQATAVNPQDSRQFHENVLPVLREHCFRCHGDKSKGGLKLNTRDHALQAGDSGTAAIVPGDPDSSEAIARILTSDESIRMPPTEGGLSEQDRATLTAWVKDGAVWPVLAPNSTDLEFAPLVDDAAFQRRVWLDLVGVPPSATEAAAFLADESPDKRTRLIDQLLQDERVADQWMSFWLDLLAENPTLLNASLNSTGPFRWFLYDSLRDRKPLDQMVTELLLMRGDPHEGGSAGFAIAAENDSPFAAKGHIVASAFLGIELQCARCHDSPYHSTKQQDLYALAAMFERKAVTVPKTSRVPAAFFEKKAREALIVATLNPDEPVNAIWPFEETTGVADNPDLQRLLRNPEDTRERLAALITAPGNQRFARVFVNRIWKRLMGAGFVEPVHDWEGRDASHPELLDWLAAELIRHDYDANHIVRLIVTSDAYQRAASGHNAIAAPESRLFTAP